MMWSLVIQTLTFRASVIFVDYIILAIVLKRPVEAGFITIIRHTFHTLIYWRHEVAWAHRRLDVPVSNISASRRHTIKKMISFRAISLAADFLLLWLLTNSISASSAGAVIIGITNTFFFYYHDRWWETWRTHHATNHTDTANNPNVQPVKEGELPDA